MKDRLQDTARWSLLGLAIGASLALSACNTMEGAGQDVEAAGDTIEDTAHDTKHNM